MDALDKSIAYNIKRVAGVQDTASPRHPIMSGVVKKVNEAELTCTVLLTMDGGEPTEGVLLGTMPDNGSGLVLVPKDNSKVLVAEIDGPGRWTVIRATDLKKVLVSAEVVIEMNGGEHGGVVKVQELVNRLNAVEGKINDFIGKWNSFATDYVPGSPTTSGMPLTLTTEVLTELTETTVADIENPKFTH